MIFTVEEENLLCIFDTADRVRLIGSIRKAIPDFDEPDMVPIAESTLRKLEAMSDSEYNTLEFCPTYYDTETEEYSQLK